MRGEGAIAGKSLILILCIVLQFQRKNLILIVFLFSCFVSIGRHFRGRYDTFQALLWVLLIAGLSLHSSMVYAFPLSHDLSAFRKYPVIHIFLLQLFLLGQPY
ncbi:hypothetical protein RchiOBHm_Chr1g0329661 [Rosa chinensis]|uniref:Uncharacterized protein n=1 Tax=Rosa chinensis TaxID=74649 RepID=A0A2P6SB22_ROSCH|nr:hypothetical protein RchiOBHm_Chr1g0329661 [Rosa chinensis]